MKTVQTQFSTCHKRDKRQCSKLKPGVPAAILCRTIQIEVYGSLKKIH